MKRIKKDLVDKYNKSRVEKEKEPSKTEDLNDLTTGDGVYKGA